MKYCLNCNSLNESEALQCSNCRMKGRFSAPIEDAPAQEQQDNPGITACQCRNCGADTQGQDRCPGCRFPVRPGLQMNAIRLNIKTNVNPIRKIQAT